MTRTNSISIERLYARIDADFETGTMTWKDCPLMDKSWRARHAGKPALNVPCTQGYLNGRIDYQRFRAHRVIWALFHGAWPQGEIDHINGIRSDNRIANLRLVSPAENKRNVAMRRDNTSGVSGVCWVPTRQKWEARVKTSGRYKHLGYFDSIDAASSARAEALQLYGFSPRHGKPLSYSEYRR